MGKTGSVAESQNYSSALAVLKRRGWSFSLTSSTERHIQLSPTPTNTDESNIVRTDQHMPPVGSARSLQDEESGGRVRRPERIALRGG